MPARSLPILAASLALSAALAGCASTAAPVHARAPTESRHVYRLDYVVTTTDPARAPVASTYTLSPEEERSGELRAGSNVVLTPSNARQDVGLRIHCQYSLVGDQLLLHNNAEITSFDDTPMAVRKLSMGGDALVAPGAPVLVASAEEPVSHKRYQVMVTATKLR